MFVRYKLILPSKKMTLFILLVILAALTRIFEVHMAFGERVVFCNLFLILALRIYGPVWTLPSAVMINLFSLICFGNSYASVLFLLELFVLTLLLKLRVKNIVLWDMIYWGIAAIPIILLESWLLLHQIGIQVYYLIFTLIINGIFNALVSDVLITYTPINRYFRLWNGGSLRITIKKIIFHLSCVCIFGALMIFLIFNSAYNESSVLDDVKKNFKSQEAQVQDEFSQWNSENRLGLKLNSVIQKGRLTNLIAEKSPSPMISQVYNRSGRLIATNTSSNISDLDLNTKGNMIQISKKLYEWIPKQTGMTGTLSKWGQTTYVYNYKLDDMNVITQIPVEIYRIKMFDSIKTLLVIIIFFCILIVLFAIMINNVFIQSLLKLTHVTTYLPSKLKNGDIVTWPKSSISEIGSLVSNFQEMSDNLAGMIGQLQTVNQQLYDQTIKLKESESQLYQNAFYDVLTGLPNRFNFLNYLKKLIDGMEEEKTVAVMFIDIDRFKHINDTLGHTAGDILLKTIANRFKNAVEGTSSKGFFVARLGGDEFVVVLNNVSDDEIENAAVLLIESLSEPIDLFDYNLHIKASIGISVYPSDGKDPDEIVKNADTSMYVAKKSGGNSFKYYSCIFNKELTEKMDIELDIYKALERNEFILYYQPKVDTLTGRIIAAEALIRWLHPKYGMVRPDQFIYIAEETGLIAEIGEWVLNETSRYIKYLHDSGYPEIRISFNWSPVQFNSQNIVALIENALKNTGLEARYLEVEITESFLIKNIDAVSNQLSKLKEIGVNISIDDFGKEYSSLGLLRSIPINCIKIDKSFMYDIPDDSGNCSIVRAIVNVAHDLGFHVTAEGVETKGQADFLKSLACDEMQGYLISYPLPKEDFEKLLSRTKVKNFQLDVLEEIV